MATTSAPATTSTPAATSTPAGSSAAVQPSMALQAAQPRPSRPGLLGGFVGGLVGGLADIVDTTLGTALHSVTGVLGPVGTTGPTDLPSTAPEDGDDPSSLPIDGVLGPVFSDGSASGGVTATVPTLIGAVVAPPGEVAGAPVPVVPAAVAEAPTTANPGAHGRGLTQLQLPTRVTTHPGTPAPPQHDSDTHAGYGGGGSGGGGGGLPATPSAPMAPTTTASPGHDHSGGARHTVAVSGDSSTTTQLRLIGVSRDHEVDGAGREAALPTTSPD
ncbi:hypothetical protein [Amycolatopsis sp. PS_44_ISF1]|uniref:hypothetical protein n=1 Tax=Amycolatopsis sp. PS_44_ISF1 TaxID=2974917 RepID=UPI0028DF06A8|nr:hypothetical protein [Amycolatopsis sp. PS_44_ISF1]MDT8909962.1 hypothetical protein [Amycolatopsis sp. PS_44_ISF1]